MATISVTDARAALPELLDRVLAGEEVTITRHGVAVAVLVHPDALTGRRASGALADAARVREVLERGRAATLDQQPTLTNKRAAALVAAVRADREGR